MNKKGYINISKASAYAGVARSTIYEWLKVGLKSHKIGGLRLIELSELDAFIESGTNNYQRK